MTALLTATRAVLSYATLSESARAIFDQACTITGARSGYVALLSEDGSENELLFLEAGGLPCSVDPELPMPIRGLREVAYRTQATVYDNDFMHSEWVEMMPGGHVDLRNVMFAPLTIDGTTVGIMGLANKPEDFTERDAHFATTFGEFAAIALHNSRTLDTLQSTIDTLQSTLQEVHELRDILPICMKCRKVRSDDGYWAALEEYVERKAHVLFSHSYCPECSEQVMRELDEGEV